MLTFTVTDRGQPLYDEALRFAQERYRRTHQAALDSVAPRLLVAHQSGRLRGCLGLTCAASAPLLAERYLDAGLEATIAARTGCQPLRRAIVEIGSLAATSARVALALLQAAPAALQDGYRYALVTATRLVRRLMRRAGMVPLTLGPARKEALPAGQQQAWGRYYEADPQVMLLDLHPIAGGLSHAA